MDAEEFRVRGKQMVDFIADYWSTLRERTPLPDVKPGYIWQQVSETAPESADAWEDIFADLEKVVVGPNTHWHHPHFFAYYPSANSYPSIMGDMLSAALGCVGFSWNSSPSCTELEMVVTDWLVKLMHMPNHFLNAHPGPGAGMIQGTASESTLVVMLAARNRASRAAAANPSYFSAHHFPRLFSYYDQAKALISPRLARRAKQAEVNHVHVDKSAAEPSEVAAGSGPSSQHHRLVVYCSDQAHSSVEKAAMLAAVAIRKVPTRAADVYALRADALERAVAEDAANGLLPFMVVATIGSTNCCSVDNVAELGVLCRRYDLWLHVDAAYAGSAAVCPEFRHLNDGVEFADSYNFNAHKMLMVNFDCSVLWFKNAAEVEKAFIVDPLYLKHAHQQVTPDFRNWQIPLGRRFRSLKVWFVLRAFGAERLREHVRKMVQLASEFESLVVADDRYELFLPRTLGLVCFRLKGPNEINEELVRRINDDRRIHLVPGSVQGSFFARLAICSDKTTSDDVVFAWRTVQQIADALPPHQ